MHDSLYPQELFFDTIKPIKRESDFPVPILAPDGVMRIPLEVGIKYEIDTSDAFFLVTPFLWPEVFTAFKLTIVSSPVSTTIVYLGSALLNFGREVGSPIFRDIVFFSVFKAPNFDLQQKTGLIQQFQSEGSAFDNFGDLGLIDGFSTIAWRNNAFTNFTNALKINNPNSINIKDILWINPIGSTDPCVVITGSATTIVFDTSDLQLSSGNSYMALDSGLVIDSQAQLLNQGFPGFPSTTFFQSDIVDAITSFIDSPDAPGVDTRCIIPAETQATIFRFTTIPDSTNHNGTHKITRVDPAKLYFDIDFPFAGGPDSGTSTVSSLEEDNIKVVSFNNGAQRDSVKSATSHLETSITVVGSGAAFTVINGGNWITDADEQFTVDNNGKLTYLGINPTDFNVFSSATINVPGNNNSASEICKNGTSIAASRGMTANAVPTQVTGFAFVSLESGDFLELAVNNLDAATDVTVLIANLTAIRS